MVLNIVVCIVLNTVMLNLVPMVIINIVLDRRMGKDERSRPRRYDHEAGGSDG